MPLGTDTCRINFRQVGEVIDSGQHIPGAGGIGILRLITNRRGHGPRAEGINRTNGDGCICQRHRRSDVMNSQTKAARDDDHHRERPGSPRQKQAALNALPWQIGGFGYCVEIIPRISRLDPK